ncbi:MAG TPA: hypothetical protein VIJ39_11020 [Solirubrobacteraceae bacterium]
MQDDPSMDSPDVLRDASVIESGIYDRLVSPDQQRPWALRELVLEIGSRIDVEDALARLHGAGLVHRCGEFVWATRAALAADAIEL